MNKLFYGDNLDVLRGFGDGCVDLIYLDPPFNSNAGYNVLFKSASGAGADASIKATIPGRGATAPRRRCSTSPPGPTVRCR